MTSPRLERARSLVPFTAFALLAASCALFPDRTPLLPEDDVAWLTKLSADVVAAARVLEGESAGGHGPNLVKCTLYRPGGRDDYPAFWIRDYALSIDCGLIPWNEQLPLLRLVAASQAIAPQPKLLPSGSQIPDGAVPDHVTFAGVPIFFPGTVDDAVHQGGGNWGAFPPLDGGPFLVHLVHEYVVNSGDVAILHESLNGTQLVDRLRAAVATMPLRPDRRVVHVEPGERGINFGFDDSVVHTGDLLFASLLEFRAKYELAELLDRLGHQEMAGKPALGVKATAEAELLREEAIAMRRALADTFALPDGLMTASTGMSAQPDVWGTAFGVYVHAFPPAVELRACAALASAYSAGTIAWHGAIRHVPTDADARADSAWERSLSEKNRYQNGAYWSTPTGWVAYAIAQVDRELAARLLREFVDDLRAGDFRQGPEFGAPWECMHPDGDWRQNPVYMTSVTAPLAAIQRLERER
jgi:hypothetical protein